MSLGLVETARVERGVVPLWPLHLQRLRASALALGLPLPGTPIPAGALVRASAACPAAVVAVRVTLRDGTISLEPRAVVDAPPEGWRAAAAAFPRPYSPLSAHKTTARGAADAAGQAVRARGYDEALWVGPAGGLTEGTITNLFVRRGSRIITPPTEGGLLPGIARGRLLARRMVGGCVVEEGALVLADLLEADEAFLTNAVRGAIPLTAWEGQRLSTGELWRRAMAAIFAQPEDGGDSSSGHGGVTDRSPGPDRAATQRLPDRLPERSS